MSVCNGWLFLFVSMETCDCLKLLPSNFCHGKYAFFLFNFFSDTEQIVRRSAIKFSMGNYSLICHAYPGQKTRKIFIHFIVRFHRISKHFYAAFQGIRAQIS